MNWLAITVAGLLLAIISFMLGVSFGASSANQSIIETILPITGSVGEWVSGLGTLGAVGFAYWQFSQFRKDELENILIRQGFDGAGWTVEVICSNRRTITVMDIHLLSHRLKTTHALNRCLLRNIADKFTTRLEQGESKIFSASELDLAKVTRGEVHASLEEFLSHGASIIVETTTKKFDQEIHPDALACLRDKRRAYELITNDETMKAIKRRLFN